MRTLRELLAATGVVVLIVWLATAWPSLPAQVPQHFGWSGPPDHFGPKAGLLFLPAVAILLYSALTVISRFSSTFNYPTAITDSNRDALQRLGVDLISWLKVEVVWTFVWLTATIVRIATGKTSGLNSAFVPIVLGLTAITIGIHWRRMLSTSDPSARPSAPA